MFLIMLAYLQVIILVTAGLLLQTGICISGTVQLGLMQVNSKDQLGGLDLQDLQDGLVLLDGQGLLDGQDLQVIQDLLVLA
jgi:hypothetical protein